MLEHHTIHPEIRHFYEMPEDTMKRGGKKRKAKKVRHATNINENKVSVHVDVGKTKPEFSRYKAITSVSRMATPNQAFANPPQAQTPSYFAVPNGVGLWENVRPATFQGAGLALHKPQTQEVPIGANPNPAQVPNRQGLEPVSTHAQRATPTNHASGGVMSNNPVVLAKQAEEATHLQEAIHESVRYFKPTGRDNIPAPRSAQHVVQPSGFFPLQGQQPETRETEMKREAKADLPLQQPIEFASPMGHRALHERQTQVLSNEKARRTRAYKSSQADAPGSAHEYDSSVAAQAYYPHLKYGGHPTRGLMPVVSHSIF